jgi:hypothetical protein
MTGRIDSARAAFAKIYENNVWKLHPEPDTSRIERVASLISKTIGRLNTSSVVEFGCGFWNYANLVDWSGMSYDGYDVASGPINWNADAFGASHIRFHHMTEGTELPKADLLFSKDVLQHLPTEDILHYLALFKSRFSYLLIINDIEPDTNLNGQIRHGGYRALRLDLPPFNETYETLDEWDASEFGVGYRKRACLLRGTAATPVASVRPGLRSYLAKTLGLRRN